MSTLPAIPIIDIRDGGPLDHARQNAEQARALRDACLEFFPAAAKPLVPALDWASRRWLGRSRSPYVAEIARIADALNFSGIWLLNASYQWGCTARAVEHDGAPWLMRTLDWPFKGLGRHIAVARMRGAGDRRFLQRDLAGLCRRAHRDGARPLCRLHQPGADVAAHAASLAAAVRFRGERAEDLAAHRSHAAGSAAAPGFRDVRGLFRGAAHAGNDAGGAAGDFYADRLRRQRALRDRAHRDRFRHPRGRHLRRQRLGAAPAGLGRPHRHAAVSRQLIR